MRTTGGLSYRHGFRRSHGQLQRLAQGRQVRIPWTNAIVLPEVNAGLTDTDLLGDFGNDNPRLMRASRRKRERLGLRGNCQTPSSRNIKRREPIGVRTGNQQAQITVAQSQRSG